MQERSGKRRKTSQMEGKEDIGERVFAGLGEYAKQQSVATKSESPSQSKSLTQKKNENFLYTKLPDYYFPPELLGKSFSVPSFLKSFLPTTIDADEIFSKKIKQRVLLLDNKRTVDNLQKRKEKELKKKKAKIMNSKERRQKKLFIIKPENKKYDMYLPLHEMWMQYMDDLMEGANAHTFPTKLLKADFHGCILTVTRSKCPSNVGTTGIMIQETEGTFQIVTRDNKLKVIPKKNHVFSLQWRTKLITLYGNNMLYRASERSARKYKYKPTVDM